MTNTDNIKIKTLDDECSDTKRWTREWRSSIGDKRSTYSDLYSVSHQSFSLDGGLRQEIYNIFFEDKRLVVQCTPGLTEEKCITEVVDNIITAYNILNYSKDDKRKYSDDIVVPMILNTAETNEIEDLLHELGCNRLDTYLTYLNNEKSVITEWKFFDD